MTAHRLRALIEGAWCGPRDGRGAAGSQVRAWPAGTGGWCALQTDGSLDEESRALYCAGSALPGGLERALREGAARRLEGEPGVVSWRLTADPVLRGTTPVRPPDRGPVAASGRCGTFVGYKPLRRLVVRHDSGASGGERFVKYLPKGRAVPLLGLHRALEAWAEADAHGFRLPRVLAHGERPDHLVWSAAPGRLLGHALRAADDRAAALAGRSLASLHACPVRVVRRLSRDAELGTIRRWLHLAGSLGERPEILHAALSRLERTASAPPETRAVLLHGDFHDGQLLVDGDRATLLDIDGVGVGEPELDLGNLLAHVDFLGLQFPAVDLAACKDAFVDAYAAARRFSPSPSRLQWYRAAAALRLACVHAARSATRDLAPRMTLLAQRLTDQLSVLREVTTS